MTTKVPEHDLNHESYIDPKDGKEHVNHGMLEYSKKIYNFIMMLFMLMKKMKRIQVVLRLMIGTQDMRINI